MTDDLVRYRDGAGGLVPFEGSSVVSRGSNAPGSLAAGDLKQYRFPSDTVSRGAFLVGAVADRDTQAALQGVLAKGLEYHQLVRDLTLAGERAYAHLIPQALVFGWHLFPGGNDGRSNHRGKNTLTTFGDTNLKRGFYGPYRTAFSFALLETRTVNYDNAYKAKRGLRVFLGSRSNFGSMTNWCEAEHGPLGAIELSGNLDDLIPDKLDTLTGQIEQCREALLREHFVVETATDLDFEVYNRTKGEGGFKQTHLKKVPVIDVLSRPDCLTKAVLQAYEVMCPETAAKPSRQEETALNGMPGLAGVDPAVLARAVAITIAEMQRQQLESGAEPPALLGGTVKALLE